MIFSSDLPWQQELWQILCTHHPGLLFAPDWAPLPVSQCLDGPVHLSSGLGLLPKSPGDAAMTYQDSTALEDQLHVQESSIIFWYLNLFYET